jgi:hypothetical protein
MITRAATTFLLAFALIQPALAETTLEGTMQALAAIREGNATFSEEKAIPELSAPLPSTGTLTWTAPDRLEKHTTWPTEEMLRIEGDHLLLIRPGQNIRQELSLDQSPDIRPFVEAIRSTMAGDLPTLRRYFEIDFRPDGEGWSMRLTPLSSRIRVALQGVDIQGKGSDLLRVETRGSDGITRLRITPAP